MPAAPRTPPAAVLGSGAQIPGSGFPRQEFHGSNPPQIQSINGNKSNHGARTGCGRESAFSFHSRRVQGQNIRPEGIVRPGRCCGEDKELKVARGNDFEAERLRRARVAGQLSPQQRPVVLQSPPWC